MTTLEEVARFCEPGARRNYHKISLTDGLPTTPGVYIMRDAHGHALYIGKAESLRRRTRDHFLQRQAYHARPAWLESPEQNPYRAFGKANRQLTALHWRVLAFGALAGGAPDQDLPRPVEWLTALPMLPGVLFGLPARLIRFPFDTTDRRVPAVLARRYLEHFPNGEEAGELRGWLVDYEEGRGNRVAALRIAESAPNPDLEKLGRLREEAAEQAFESAEKERRIEVRVPLLQEVASQFPGTRGALQAGDAVREEMARVSEQRIRVSKGFLVENPNVIGRDGLALRPELIDDGRG